MNPDRPDIDHLTEMARQIRRDLMKMLLLAKSGHSGGTLGLSDIFSCLYFHLMNIDPKQPDMPQRFFLSVGGASLPVWYATLARRGFLPIEELSTLPQDQRPPAGASRPAYTRSLPASEVASGALGRGLSIAVGCASVFGWIKSRTGLLHHGRRR